MALVLLACGICRAGEDAGKAAKIDDLIRRYEQCGYLNGAVLVARHGKVIYARGVGEANMESHTPNTPQTKFGIASITKQFTAVLVLQQAARGNLRLDDHISQYLPWYRSDTGERITIEQLLHHTSGLPPDYDWPEFCDTPEAARHYEPREFAEKFCQPALIARPGTKWAYSNCGYILLGLILEKVSGKSFGDLLSRQILDPLGMKNTGIDRNDLVQLGGAAGYVRHAGPRYTPGPYLDRAHIFAAGAMYSTVEDLFLWNQALSSNVLLPGDLRDQVFKPQKKHWACGWFVTTIPPGRPGAGNTLAEMRGDMTGNYFAWILRYPRQDAVIVVLRNGYGSPERLEENLQAILFDRKPRLPSRNFKDIAAHAWQTTYASLSAHRLLGLVAAIFAVAGLCKIANRRRRIGGVGVNS